MSNAPRNIVRLISFPKKVGCFTKVIDAHGAGGTSTALVHVHAKSLSMGQLFNISEAKASLALDAANGDAAKQVLVATSASSSSSSSSYDVSARRRALLASATPTSDSEVLYASLLTNLWLAYDITTTTADGVASLIAVLEGIVAQPTDVASSTASSALRFLSQVWTYVAVCACVRVRVCRVCVCVFAVCMCALYVWEER